jgi:hypothetical protein
VVLEGHSRVVRSDIADFIYCLHSKDQKNLLGRYAADLEALERQLPGDAEVYAVFDSLMRPQGGDGRVGVVAITSSGVQWSGRAHHFWPWEQIQLISGASNYQATILLMNNEKVDFTINAKRDSVEKFSAAVDYAQRVHTP